MTEVGKAYGNALFLLAQEEKQEKAICDEFQAVCALLRENTDYIKLMDSRSLPKQERLTMLDEAFSGKLQTNLLSFLKILCERGSFSAVFDCYEAYLHQYHESNGILVATASISAPISESDCDRLIAALEKKTGKKIELITKVDPTLRGGMCVEMDGIRYDNTIVTKLNRLRKALSATV